VREIQMNDSVESGFLTQKIPNKKESEATFFVRG
jgi:hypothetical protein